MFFHPLYSQNFRKTDDYPVMRKHGEKDTLNHYCYACKLIQSSLEDSVAVSIKKSNSLTQQFYL